jgi:hypothetical protein
MMVVAAALAGFLAVDRSSPEAWSTIQVCDKLPAEGAGELKKKIVR